jgi:hypothetical protein
MKKVVLSMFSCLLFGLIQAQITVTAVPPGPRFTLDDLWQVTLVENMAPNKEVWLSVSIHVYEQSGSKILTTTTKKFQFSKASIININKTNLDTYGPISTVYHQRSFKNELAKQGGVFPSGDYKIEVICNYEGNGFAEPLGKYVYNINAELMLPIQLVSVFNKDTIEEENPMFTWIPPYPIPTGNITYEIVLNQVQPNETKFTALATGTPLVKSQINNQNSFIYTPGSPKLQSGNTYAWQVNMFVDGKFYVGSDTWEFYYRVGQEATIEMNRYYLMKEKINNAQVIIDSNILPINFIENYIVLDSVANIYIFDENYDTIATNEEVPLFTSEGSNYCYLNFCPDIYYLPNGYYVLKLVLVNKRNFYIRFENNSGAGVCYE